MTNRPACATAALRLGSILLTAPLIVCTLLIGACSSTTSSPTSPTKLEPPPGAYRSTFTALKGETGFAGMSITPKAIPEGTMRCRHQRSSRGAETEHDLPVPASTGRSWRPRARLGWDLPACPGTPPLVAERPARGEFSDDAPARHGPADHHHDGGDRRRRRRLRVPHTAWFSRAPPTM